MNDTTLINIFVYISVYIHDLPFTVYMYTEDVNLTCIYDKFYDTFLYF